MNQLIIIAIMHCQALSTGLGPQSANLRLNQCLNSVNSCVGHQPEPNKASLSHCLATGRMPAPKAMPHKATPRTGPTLAKAIQVGGPR